MNIIYYFFIGLTTAVVGALPLGTTNVAVINTTIKENIQNALKIVYTAAFAEMILIITALTFNAQIESFMRMNPWVLYIVIAVMFTVGIVLVIGRKECVKDENDECIYVKKRRIHVSKQMLGFLLGLINPTVLIYWLFVISYLSKKMIYLNISVACSFLIIFLIGAFLGKVITLYGYGKFSFMLKQKIKNITTTVNRVIGVLLIFVSVFQLIKLFY